MTPRYFGPAGTLLVLLAQATHAFGEPISAPKPAPPARTWYGWQTLLVDGASIAVGVTAAATLRDELEHAPPSSGLVAASMFGIGAIGAPAVHYAHGNVGVGAADFGVRLLLPPTVSLFGVLGACASRRNGFENDDCAQDGFAAGALIGSLAAAGIDAGVFAWDRAPQEPKPERYWYGWQTLTLDAGALAWGVYFASREPKTKEGKPLHPALATWVPLYTVGIFSGPIVHFANGRVGYGFLSLGIRAVVGPLAALPGFVGYCAASGGVSDCIEDGAQWGILGGQIAVGLFDAFVLAREKAPTPPKAVASWVPTLQFDQHKLLLGAATAW